MFKSNRWLQRSLRVGHWFNPTNAISHRTHNVNDRIYIPPVIARFNHWIAEWGEITLITRWEWHKSKGELTLINQIRASSLLITLRVNPNKKGLWKFELTLTITLLKILLMLLNNPNCTSQTKGLNNRYAMIALDFNFTLRSFGLYSLRALDEP